MGRRWGNVCCPDLRRLVYLVSRKRRRSNGSASIWPTKAVLNAGSSIDGRIQGACTAVSGSLTLIHLQFPGTHSVSHIRIHMQGYEFLTKFYQAALPSLRVIPCASTLRSCLCPCGPLTGDPSRARQVLWPADMLLYEV